MTKTSIKNYIRETPENTNLSVIDSMLTNYINQAVQIRTGLIQLDDYLYYLETDKIDYEAVMQSSNEASGKCSSMRKGNFYGRNFDWNYDNENKKLDVYCQEKNIKYSYQL